MAWHTGTYSEMARAKKAFMLKSDFRGILSAFPPTFGPPKTDFGNDSGHLVGTPDDPTVLYDSIIQAPVDAVNLF